MDHKKLDVWKKSMELVQKVYFETKQYPKDELYGLTSQTRRSAVSVPSNIAEGAARNGDKELIQYLYISLGSLAELDTQIQIAVDLNYINPDVNIENGIISVRQMLLGLIKFLRNKSTKS